jgi:acetyl-CoA carboxylase biotin carboxyl carrier protein
MDQQQIKAFIDVMAASDLAEMEFSQDGWTLRLVRRTAASEDLAATSAPAIARPLMPAADTQPEDTESNELRAPLFGVVHLQRSPDEPPLVKVGQAVKAGQALCVIEAMKVFNEVRAERDATVAAVLVTSGQEVDAGQPLLRFT